ncbi:MAG: hypothetical protein GTN82_35950, partial [Candidatus Aminicenantes bacterium]|nr:hypothetical protein [Candidatus Aminicenantes bacterium]
MKNQYWFYIDPYVHISLKGEAILFYNTYTGKIQEYIRNSLVLRLVKRLLSSRNLRVIPLKKSDLANPLIREFVDNVKEYFMGDLIDASYSEGKPIQMPPIVKIQKDVKYLKAESVRSVGEGIMHYLSEIFLYVNDSCYQNCSICDIAYKQLPFCTARKKRNLELNLQHLEKFFEEIMSSTPVTLNILGGDIFKYSGLKKLVRLIES